ncbi:hypothetical protein D3C87_1547540 [compost metagenome]
MVTEIDDRLQHIGPHDIPFQTHAQRALFSHVHTEHGERLRCIRRCLEELLQIG